MTLFVIILFLVCLYGIRFNAFNDDYLSVPKSTSIKGIFAVLILLSHIRGYNVYDVSSPGCVFLTLLGQMIVVMYFFYSGYGIAEQYKKRGDDYVRSFPMRRVFKTLLHFDIAVLFFIILQTVLGNFFQLSDYLLSLIGWTSVGNSNWFVFDILVLYSLTFVVFYVCSVHALSVQRRCLIITLLTVLLWLFLFLFRRDQDWWMNTIIAFPLGFWYSKEKVRVDSLFKAHFLLAFIPLFLWILWRYFIGIDIYGISAVLFAISVVGLTTKVSIDNKVLRWLGSNCFEIYILQRLPMILLASFGFQKYCFVFTILVMLLTLMSALFFHRFLYVLDRRLGIS